MKMIRFRRLSRPARIIDGIRVETWETALNETHLHEKLNGEMAEVIMPAKPWLIRLWRRFFPLQFTEANAPLTSERSELVVIRKTDGAIFKPSFPRPDEYAKHGGPMDSLFNGSAGFFFRRIERRGWWIFKVWVETGEIWKPESGDFDVSKS